MVTQRSTGWVGWIYYASIMMVLAGTLNILAGVVGIFNGNFYASLNGQLIAFDYGTWGWIHLLLGLAVVATGVGLITGKYWARIVGMALIVISIVANVAFLPVYPWWSTIVLIVDGLVLYAIAMHSDEVR